MNKNFQHLQSFGPERCDEYATIIAKINNPPVTRKSMTDTSLRKIHRHIFVSFMIIIRFMSDKSCLYSGTTVMFQKHSVGSLKCRWGNGVTIFCFLKFLCEPLLLKCSEQTSALSLRARRHPESASLCEKVNDGLCSYVTCTYLVHRYHGWLFTHGNTLTRMLCRSPGRVAVAISLPFGRQRQSDTEKKWWLMTGREIKVRNTKDRARTKALLQHPRRTTSATARTSSRATHPSRATLVGVNNKLAGPGLFALSFVRANVRRLDCFKAKKSHTPASASSL